MMTPELMNEVEQTIMDYCYPSMVIGCCTSEMMTLPVIDWGKVDLGAKICDRLRLLFKMPRVIDET